METIGKSEFFFSLVNITGSFRWNPFNPHLFPDAHIKRKELQSNLKTKLGCFWVFFCSPLSHFPVKVISV